VLGGSKGTASVAAGIIFKSCSCSALIRFFKVFKRKVFAIGKRLAYKKTLLRKELQESNTNLREMVFSSKSRKIEL
jgi:hypothetical protein